MSKNSHSITRKAVFVDSPAMLFCYSASFALIFRERLKHELDRNLFRGAAGVLSRTLLPLRHGLGDALEHHLRINPRGLGRKIRRDRKFQSYVIILDRTRQTFFHTARM